MLASTERSLEIERQRRSQLQRVDQFRGGGTTAAGCHVDASTSFRSPRSSKQFVKCTGPKTTTVGQSMMASLANVQQLIGPVTSNDCTNNDSGDSVENRKLKNGNTCVRIRHHKIHKSMVSDSKTLPDTSSATNIVPVEVVGVQSVHLDTDMLERQINDSELRSGRDSQTVDGGSMFPTRRWSSLKELRSREALSQLPTSGSSGVRRGVNGRRTSRLDRHVYQCYFAGVLHSSRRSDRFVRLQQLYSMLENVVEMETDMLSLRHRIKPRVTDYHGCQSSHASHPTDPSHQKYWCQRSVELRKLYAKLDAAQEEKEFFYDNGRLDTFQWKSWKDLGLSRKDTSLTKLKDLFEAAVVDSRSAVTTTTSQLQHVERGLSYRKLLGMFQCLEKRSRKEAEAWLRWQSSSQQSMTSGRNLDGTYIKMMESAASNAKSLALHGYHMNEHCNRYDAYVQSRRIYRPKSSHSIFDQLSSDDQLETDEVASSDRTTTTISLSNIRCCKDRSDVLIAKPASDLSDSSQVPSPVTSVCSAPNCAASAQQADTCAEIRYPSEKQLCHPALSVKVAAVVKESLPEVVNCDEQLGQQQVATDDDRGISVDEHDVAIAKLSSGLKQKSRKRERQRPRCRNGNGTICQRTDTLSAFPGSTGRRHIEAWRRSTRPLSGTLNQALAYFNSLCIDESNGKNDQSGFRKNNHDSKVSSNENYETRDQINDAEIFNHLTPAFPVSTENEECPVVQLADCEKKFSTEIKLDVNSSESVIVPDRRKIVLPQLYSCRDEVRGEDFPTSPNVASLPPPMCSRAVNIDKHRSQYKIDTTEPNSQSRKYAGADAHKAETETAGGRPLTSQSDVPTTPEVHPTYVKSAPVVRMLSESQPIQTTSVSSPVFVDCRQAVVHKLPTLINQCSRQQQQAFNDCMSNPALCTDTTSTGKFIDFNCSCPDDEAKQMAEKIYRSNREANKVAATQRSSLPDDLPSVRTNVMYVTAINSSSFTCKLCCRSLAACNCASIAEAGTGCGSEERVDNVDCGHHGRSNDSGKSELVESAENFMSTASRSVRDVNLQPVTETADPSRRELRPIISNRPGIGRQDVEIRRIMDSLETIDSEWTSGRATRLTQLASDMNNNSSQARQWKNSDISDEQRLCLTLGHLNQRENDKRTASYMD